jgi:hypothetical protein
VDKLFGITDVVMIGDRLSTILAEARNKTDVRLQVDFGISEDGVPVERYIAVVQVGPGHRQRFDISERDFKFLRWTGTDVEIVACPKAYRALNRLLAPDVRGSRSARAADRYTGSHRSRAGHLLMTE